jgi:hypothetical protein
MYWVTPSKCGLRIQYFIDAFYFSLSTGVTIGYGVKDDIYFHQCGAAIVFIFFQSCTTILLNGFLVGMIIVRLATARHRGRTVVFSDKAIIRRIRGQLYFMFQVGELRSHQLVESHVRFVGHPSLPNCCWLNTCNMSMKHHSQCQQEAATVWQMLKRSILPQTIACIQVLST